MSEITPQLAALCALAVPAGSKSRQSIIKRSSIVHRAIHGSRAQQRLNDLHRAVSIAGQRLTQHHSMLAITLRDADLATRQSLIEEHCHRIGAAAEALAALATFVDDCRRNEAVLLPTPIAQHRANTSAQ